MQQQAMQRPVTEQSLLENQSAKKTEEQRSQNSAVEGASKAMVHTNGEGAEQHHSNKDSKRQNEKEEMDSEAPAHPYKGHHLDITL